MPLFSVLLFTVTVCGTQCPLAETMRALHSYVLASSAPGSSIGSTARQLREPLFTAGLFHLFFGVYIQSLRRDDSFQGKLMRTKTQTNDCWEHANLSVSPPYLWTPYSRNEPFKGPNLQEKLHTQFISDFPCDYFINKKV